MGPAERVPLGHLFTFLLLICFVRKGTEKNRMKRVVLKCSDILNMPDIFSPVFVAAKVLLFC